MRIRTFAECLGATVVAILLVGCEGADAPPAPQSAVGVTQSDTEISQASTSPPAEVYISTGSGGNSSGDGSGSLGGGNLVYAYLQTGGAPILTISKGLKNPRGLATDKDGNLYIANEGADQIRIYAPGKTSPKQIIPDLQPYGVALDTQGNIWASNYSNVQEYSSTGVLKETIMCHNDIAVRDYTFPPAVDRNGDVFVVAQGGSANGVFEIPSGKTKCTPLGVPTNLPAGISVLHNNDLVVEGDSNLMILKAPEYVRITRKEPIPTFINDSTVTAEDKDIWVTTLSGHAYLLPYPKDRNNPSVIITLPDNAPTVDVAAWPPDNE